MYIEVKNIDTNLFSGSLDRVRQTLGGYWMVNSSSETGYSMDFINTEQAAVTDGFLDVMSMDATMTYTTASSELLIPSYKIPLRYIGNEDKIANDDEWKAIVLGGTYLTTSYDGLYRAGRFDSHNFMIKPPYSLYDAKLINSNSYADYGTYNIGCQYKHYLPEYEQYLSTLNNDLLIPNAYFLHMYAANEGFSPPLHEFDSELTNFISREGVVTEPFALLATTKTDYLPTYSTYNRAIDTGEPNTYTDQSKVLWSYLTGTLPSNGVSTETAGYMTSRTNNLIFQNEHIRALYSPALLQDGILEWMPYHVSLDVPFESADLGIRDIIEANGYYDLFLAHLKRDFSENAENYDIVSAVTYDKNESGNITTVTDRKTGAYRSVNFLEMLARSFGRVQTASPINQIYMSPLTEQIKELRNANGAYRYAHSIPVYKTLKETIKFLQNNPIEGVSGDQFNLAQFLNGAESVKEAEVLAYKIEKSSLTSAGTTATQTSTQTIWMPASVATGGGLQYFDTQVRYGATYNYRVTAYVAVAGYDYAYSDARVTKLINDEGYGSETSIHHYNYCLEFQDAGGAPAARLYTEGGVFGGAWWASEATALSDLNDLGTEAQVLSKNRYLADFHITAQPSIKIMEVLVASKQVSIVDNPPGAVDVTPYQRMDDSQVIGFYAKHESFTPQPLPTSINASEEAYKADYLRSKNMFAGESITVPSVSKPSAVEIYRLNHRPISIASFAGSLIETKDLTIPGTKYFKTNCFYEEVVETNKKYYYLFRFINEHGIPGMLSPVHVAELVDDGGYKFSLFDVIYESEFEVAKNLEVAQPLRKLMRILPSPQNIIIDDSGIDYAQPALDQIGNLAVGTDLAESIWDKKFKFRLTSRKTGKKIDLNVTYRIKDGI